MIPLTRVVLDDVDEEIHLEGQVIGFIHRDGRIFVALTGSRIDRAEGMCAIPLVGQSRSDTGDHTRVAP